MKRSGLEDHKSTTRPIGPQALDAGQQQKKEMKDEKPASSASDKRRWGRSVTVTFTSATIPKRLRDLAYEWGLYAPDGTSAAVSYVGEYLLLPSLEAAEAGDFERPPVGWRKRRRLRRRFDETRNRSGTSQQTKPPVSSESADPPPPGPKGPAIFDEEEEEEKESEPSASDKDRWDRCMTFAFTSPTIRRRLQDLAYGWDLYAPDGTSAAISSGVEWLILPRLEDAEAGDIEAPPIGWREKRALSRKLAEHAHSESGG